MENKTGFGDQLGSILNRIARALSQLTVAVMVITVLAQVFMRYFIKSPLVWGDELAKYSLVFMTFIGASVALRDKQLAAMELLTEKFPGPTKRIVAIGVYIIELALLGFLFYYSIILMMEGSVQAQLSPALQIPMMWVYISLPLGLGLMIIQAIVLMINYIKGAKEEGSVMS